jgi:hypothetical protein
MLFSVQFPFADSRAFLSAKTNLLGRPTWPAVWPDVDFVRSFGSIRKRRLGGLSGWVGENALCEASRALRFSRITNYKDLDAKLSIPIRVVFRRLYFDGLAVGKFEVGLSTEDEYISNLKGKHTYELINHCLNLPVVIPGLSEKAVDLGLARNSILTKLGEAGKPLAGVYAAASVSHPPPAKIEDWWVLPGTPLLILIHQSDEKIHIPFLGKSIPRSEFLNCDLTYYEVPYANRNLRMWGLVLGENASYKDVRALKISLLRLHAEHETMRLVLQNISTNRIQIAPRSQESNTLQRYLNEATRRISRLSSQADELAEGNVAEIARESEDMVNPGERDSLLTTLQNLDVRRNIFYKVQDYVNADIYVKELYMESKYKITGGTQGAVGDNAQSSNNTFNTWNQSGGDLKALAGELAQLRAELGKQAKSSEEFESATAIAKAEAAAQKGDGSSVFEHLKSAGKWALETATSIGIPVAIQAIKTALGCG